MKRVEVCVKGANGQWEGAASDGASPVIVHSAETKFMT